MRNPSRKVLTKRIATIATGPDFRMSGWVDELECGHLVPMHERWPDAMRRACVECGARDKGRDGVCCGCQYDGDDGDVECTREDGSHCNHWWDGPIGEEAPDA